MLPRVSLEVSGTTMLALLRFLEQSSIRYDIAANEAADSAILAWIDSHQAGRARDPGGQGYRWKSLFLPSGTRVEVRTQGQTHRARVEGDALLHEGRSVSPNQFVATCAGATRNAWREISLLLPGERHWKPAYMLRKEVEQARVLAHEMAASAAAAGTSEAIPGRPVEHWWSIPPRERRLADDRRSPRGCTDFDDH